MSNNKCQCVLCTNIDKYKWAVVMECKCSCHNGDGVTGHDSLCCEYPNGLKKNNPYQNLLSAKHYGQIIHDILDKE
jgi:hypothetical protein